MPSDFIHDCILVLYKQLIQTCFGCYPSDFTLFCSVLFCPLYEDTDLRRATAHQLYSFAIEVGFGANVIRRKVRLNQIGGMVWPPTHSSNLPYSKRVGSPAAALLISWSL